MIVIALERRVGTLLAYSGVFRLARRILTARGRFVLELHGVARRRYGELPMAAQPGLSAEELERILDWVTARFAVLSSEEFFDTGRPGVLLTFDDGFANQAEVALPILAERGLPAILFPTVQHLRDPADWLPATRRLACALGEARVSADVLHDLFDGMSEGDLRSCAAMPGITIGSHTVTHPFLSQCDEERIRRELAESKQYLEQITGRAVDLIAYPSGDYSERVARLARDSGYRAAFAESCKGVFEQRFEIPRVGLYSAAPAYLSAKLSGLHQRPLSPAAVSDAR